MFSLLSPTICLWLSISSHIVGIFAGRRTLESHFPIAAQLHSMVTAPMWLWPALRPSSSCDVNWRKHRALG